MQQQRMQRLLLQFAATADRLVFGSCNKPTKAAATDGGATTAATAKKAAAAYSAAVAAALAAASAAAAPAAAKQVFGMFSAFLLSSSRKR